MPHPVAAAAALRQPRPSGSRGRTRSPSAVSSAQDARTFVGGSPGTTRAGLYPTTVASVHRPRCSKAHASAPVYETAASPRTAE
ncbi:hypothetical protein G6W57_19600 [Streptomyces sp. CAI-121]|uniref:hypothetical protein n=1 Tax=unclassified Streptomyces TaxID=2593676 RepID=UPI0015877F92|nr:MULTISPECIES: hypothetical protein [unclassified Streptomyces]NUV69323.1 hypothetical protein [Streptomyces sp. CAI-121]NUW15466.1 hypothetical protein [Streptomyces sp. CAI-68]